MRQPGTRASEAFAFAHRPNTYNTVHAYSTGCKWDRLKLKGVGSERTTVTARSEQRYLAAVPMKRFGKPDEIAAAITFLLSDDAAFITGQTLFVDGGASIGKASI